VTTYRALEPNCEWSADDLIDPSTWTRSIGAEHLDELAAALRHSQNRSLHVLALGIDDVPLPTFSRALTDIATELIDGRGFVRLRGLDQITQNAADLEVLYWGIGLHLGTPWPQNRHGHLLGDVTDQKRTLDDPTSRGNEIGGLALTLHSDGADLVGLLCLSNGIAGGMSVVSNAVRVHNQLVSTQPEVAAVLYGRYPYDYRGEEADGARPFYNVPVFTAWNGRLFVRCIPDYIRSSQRHPEAPRLSGAQSEALDLFIAMANAPDNQVRMELLPGDVQFINNYHVLHGRDAYADDADRGAVRHLKRLWLETDALADRPPRFARPQRSHWADSRSVSTVRVAEQRSLSISTEG
jgi:Taurine catabolism dioxygenase TauD, TfdA family